MAKKLLVPLIWFVCSSRAVAQGVDNCFPLDGETFKARLNQSSAVWMSNQQDDSFLTTPLEVFASLLRFVKFPDGGCHYYKIQNQQRNANTWLVVSGDCNCLRADQALEELAQPVEVLSFDDDLYKFRLDGQYLSQLPAGDCDYCAPNAVKANAAEDNAMAVFLDAVVLAEDSQPSSSEYNSTGFGFIRCPTGKFARLTFGAYPHDPECVDSCPDTEEPERSPSPGQQVRCLPLYNDHLSTAPAPELTIIPRQNGVMKLVVSTPLQPVHYAENLALLPYTIDIQPDSATPQPFSGCNSNFKANDDYHDDVMVPSWTDETSHLNDATTLIPPAPGTPIRGYYKDNTQLEKSFKIPAGVPARLSVKLYSKSTAADDSGAMYVSIDSQRRFEARRSFWCPSPMYNPSQLCEMDVVFDMVGPSTAEEVTVRLGVFGGEDLLWGFRDFHLEVSQVSAEFLYDDFMTGSCNLAQNPFAVGATHEELTGDMVVFWGSEQIAQDFVGQEYHSGLSLKYPRGTQAVTPDQYRVWELQYLGEEFENATAFESELSLHASSDSHDMSGAIRRFRQNDVVWGWHNLTTATHSLEVQEVYISASQNFVDLEGKMASLEILSQENLFPGKVKFSFVASELCESACYLHVVSWTSPPRHSALSSTTTLAPEVPSSDNVDMLVNTTTLFPGRRLEMTFQELPGRRLDHHTLPVTVGVGGSGFAVSQDTVMVEPAEQEVQEVNAATSASPMMAVLSAMALWRFLKVCFHAGGR